jgi:hypothetical protein
MMKNLFYFFSILFFAVIKTAVAQEAPDVNKFTIGAYLSYLAGEEVRTEFTNSGMKTVVWHADEGTETFLSDFDVMAFNITETDWINYYATGFYSKWEAEEDQTDPLIAGVKHRDKDGYLIGQAASWQGISCWSSIGLTGPRDSLMYGPHYSQSKWYWRALRPDVEYNIRFHMALDRDLQADDEDAVCVIKVVYRYAEVDQNIQPIEWYDDVFLERTLKVSDFLANGDFRYFDFGDQYQYPPEFRNDKLSNYTLEDSFSEEDPVYVDWFGGAGIQFWVDWLGTPNVGTLYIDFAEVYDNEGWNHYIIDPGEVEDKITNYLSNYPPSEWSNIKYWYAADEPNSIDAFIPIKTVDEIVRGEGGAPLITAFWEVGVVRNNIPIYERFYEVVQPKKLMLQSYPVWADFEQIRPEDLELLRFRFQLSHSLQPGFFYTGQGFGGIDYVTGNWYDWRFPDSTELKASVMLALAHGSKGLMFWSFDSYDAGAARVKGIVEEDGTTSDLWNVIHDNFVPRLQDGILGNTLMNLNYTGDYLPLKYFTPTQESSPPPAEYDYLILGVYATLNDMNWHAGFFDRPSHSNDKYFFLANLITTTGKSTHVKVTPPVQGFVNYRFREIEGTFDETFTTEITKQLTLGAGEGNLYQVAPVIEHGGNLVYDETAGDGIILNDDMIIDNGATLSIYENYYAKGNIIIKNGSIENYENGKIHFQNGKKLIVIGSAIIEGTGEDKLTLDFISAQNDNGIVIEEDATLVISNCVVKNAEPGILAELDAYHLDARYVDFEDCDSSSISILGQSGTEQFSPPPVSGKILYNF